MIEGEFDDFQMEELGNKYPEYDDMDTTALDNEYERLTNERLDLLRSDNPTRLEEVKNRLRYIGSVRGDGIVETKFTSDGSGKTVTIERRGQSTSAPEVQFIKPSNNPINETNKAVENFISTNYKEDFKFSPHSDKAIELRKNINITTNNNITYKPLTIRNERVLIK